MTVSSSPIRIKRKKLKNIFRNHGNHAGNSHFDHFATLTAPGVVQYSIGRVRVKFLLVYYNSGNGHVCLSVCPAIESKAFAPIGAKILTRVAGCRGLPVEKKEN